MSRLVTLTALLSVSLLMLTTLRGGLAVQVVVLLPFVASILAVRWKRASESAALSVAALVALVGFTLLRGGANGAFGSMAGAMADAVTYAIVAVFGFALFTSATPRERRDRLVAVALAPGVYVLVNVAVKFLGARGYVPLPEAESIAAETPATVLRSLGFGGAMREQLPLTTGVNGLGALSAAGFVAAAVLAWRERRLRLPAWVCAAACMYALLVCDSRLAIVLALAGTLLLILLPRARGAAGLAALVPLAPVFLVLALGYLSANTGATSTLSREGGDFATGTGRTDIWSAVWEHNLSHPSLDYVFGFGANGQLESGAYARYVQAFNGEGVFSTHNLTIQTVLDMGYVGLLVLFGAVLIAVLRLTRSPMPQSPILAGALLVLVFCGVTEALPSYLSPDTMIWFLLLLTADAASPLRKRDRLRAPHVLLPADAEPVAGRGDRLGRPPALKRVR